MKIVILDSLAIGEDLDFSLFADLGELVIYPTTASEEVPDKIADCDVVITNKLKLNKNNLDSAQNLKLICVTATGFDNIDVEYAKDRGIGVCNVVGYSTNNVAQITVGLVLDLINKTTQFRRSVSSGAYSERGVANILSPTYHEIDGLKWGIIGFGNIGKKVGGIAEALGCHVLVNKRVPVEDCGCVDVDTICRECDIISVHTPLNDSTRGLISKDRIALMKKDAILVNVARGAVTDEKAIAEAIKGGKLAGFGCDVYSVEPFGTEHPFYEIKEYDNVILTPHMAWGSYEARVRLCNEVKENIIAFFKGEIRNRIDKR
jgi:glycerate dehydrogenase